MDAGLSEREVNTVMVLSSTPNMKASEIAKKIGTTRLDAYNSLERLRELESSPQPRSSNEIFQPIDKRGSISFD